MWQRALTPPPVVRCFLLLDLLLALAYVLSHWTGYLDTVFDLGDENNVPTWYASMQYAVTALLFGAIGWLTVERDTSHSWIFFCLPLMCLMFSLDEEAALHERLGFVIDKLTLYDTRATSSLPRTGSWFLIGLPMIALLYAGMHRLYRFFSAVPLAYLRCCAGFLLVVCAAAGLDALSNLIAEESNELFFLETLLEETLEMLGSTLILWSAVELSQAVGLSLVADYCPVVEPTTMRQSHWPEKRRLRGLTP